MKSPGRCAPLMSEENTCPRRVRNAFLFKGSSDPILRDLEYVQVDGPGMATCSSMISKANAA